MAPKKKWLWWTKREMLIPCDFAGKRNHNVASMYQVVQPAAMVSNTVKHATTQSSTQ